MNDLYRPPETRGETLTAELVLVVPAQKLGSLLVWEDGTKLTTTAKPLPEGEYIVVAWPTDTTEGERIHPTASQPPLDAQDVSVILPLLEEAMEEEPYTTRAVYLSGLIDRLEAWSLEQ